MPHDIVLLSNSPAQFVRRSQWGSKTELDKRSPTRYKQSPFGPNMKTKIQIYKLFCDYRFKPSLHYYDVNNRIADVLSNDYKHWTNDGTQVRLTNFENRSAVLIAHNRLGFEIDVPDSPEEFRTKFERALREYTEKVKIDTYTRLGVRTKAMIPLPLKFSELLEITQENMLPQAEPLLKIVGLELDDYMYNVITKHGDCRLHVICGPVQRSEIPRWYTPAEISVDPGETPKEITYSDVSFFIDCDYYVEQPKLEIVERFLDDGIRAITSVPNQIGEYLFGEL